MDDAIKMVVECKAGKRVEKVDEATFNKRIKKFTGSVMVKDNTFIKTIFTSTGEYVGTCTNRLYVKDTDPSEYYIPVGDGDE